jgi:hypothetical protein
MRMTRTREFERMRGHGGETDKAGKVRAVTYNLSRMQNELFDGSGDPPIPTTRDVVGRILPATLPDREIKTLQMADGRKLKFFYVDPADGSIALNQWIG